jgi:antitoxin component YwqK of YwqJK toxin-antitoxin module
MLNNQKLVFLLSLFVLFFLTACDTPSLGKKVEKTYYTGGQLRSEFAWSDSTGKNGVMRTFGYNGHQLTSVKVTNGVRNGILTTYDEKGHVIKQTPYVNGVIQGVEKAFYTNGDVMISFNYRDNMKNGYAYTYFQGGKVCRKAKFKNNRLVN